ncbi:hypothetical protein HZU72_12260 [Halomonas sp. QX-2]|uniref:Exonuclease domain-containing protein n=1 Tax=Vreelandella sedimenti TaxID=2729618 RepID=A0A7Z0N8G1_9GAMM|nr:MULTISPECIES: hypothetical protein [Halomonas]NYT73196.1 hypothetical protein [Halomonas sedimenti]|tara:strand:- start:1890 stop:2393 length:504 start_codon:yes stop_codon:yes gene_type:complete
MDILSTNIPFITFLDIEASGLEQPSSYPIEIGWADTFGNNEGFLIRPFRGWDHWDPLAEAIHGITRDEIIEHGLHIIDAAEKLNDMLGFETVFCDALDTDYFWLKKLYEASGKEPSFKLADIYQLHKILSDEHMASMKTILKDLPIPHRAQSDAARYAEAVVSSYQI